MIIYIQYTYYYSILYQINTAGQFSYKKVIKSPKLWLIFVLTFLAHDININYCIRQIDDVWKYGNTGIRFASKWTGLRTEMQLFSAQATGFHTDFSKKFEFSLYKHLFIRNCTFSDFPRKPVILSSSYFVSSQVPRSVKNRHRRIVQKKSYFHFKSIKFGSLRSIYLEHLCQFF